MRDSLKILKTLLKHWIWFCTIREILTFKPRCKRWVNSLPAVSSEKSFCHTPKITVDV